MTPDFSKYQRQIQLKGFGLGKQDKLSKSKVLIIGLGGLGIPVAQYLNAMGIGVLGLLDGDRIALHNLHRQVLYSEGEVGQLKADVAAKKLREQNSQTEIVVIPEFLTVENALDTIVNYDVVVDASDNFATRYLVNDSCVILNKPFVYGALHDFEGQVSVFNYNNGPTYRCLFPNMPGINEIPNCDENGVLGVLPGIIGNLQALEVVKMICGLGEVLSGKLLLYDGLSQKNRLVAFKEVPENKTIRELQKTYNAHSCATIIIQNTNELNEFVGNQLIDVRSPEEFQSGHLESSKNIPLPELLEHLDELNLDQPIYLICQSGQRSQIGAQLLSDQLPNVTVFSIEGGMNQITGV